MAVRLNLTKKKIKSGIGICKTCYILKGKDLVSVNFGKLRFLRKKVFRQYLRVSRRALNRARSINDFVLDRYFANHCLYIGAVRRKFPYSYHLYLNGIFMRLLTEAPYYLVSQFTAQRVLDFQSVRMIFLTTGISMLVVAKRLFQYLRVYGVEFSSFSRFLRGGYTVLLYSYNFLAFDWLLSVLSTKQVPKTQVLLLRFVPLQVKVFGVFIPFLLFQRILKKCVSMEHLEVQSQKKFLISFSFAERFIIYKFFWRRFSLQMWRMLDLRYRQRIGSVLLGLKTLHGNI